jgi:hypothetical protein
MTAIDKAIATKLTPALGTSVADLEAKARPADVNLAMQDPAVARLDAASRNDMRRPVPGVRPEPEPETLDNAPTPFPVPKPSFGR